MRQIYLILLIVFSANIFSQNYNIKHYTVNDGLLHAFVNDIIQDSRGNIWIATGGGLCKFNGVEFINYTTKNGLNYPRLLSLAEDNNNNIWIGTLVGLNFFDGDSIYSLKNQNGNERIFSIEKSSDGKMWVSSDKGVKKVEFVDGKFIVKKVPYNFKGSEEINIFQDRKWNSFLIEANKNELYIGLNDTVYVYKDNKIEVLKIPDSLKIFSACKLNNNNILFGTNNGLQILENGIVKKYENKHLNNFNVYKIKQKDSKLWMIGNWKNNKKEELFLVSINLDNLNFYREISVTNGLINNPTSLFIDHENNVWTGSNGGLNVLKGEGFVNYTTESGLVGNKIWDIYQDKSKRIWVGTINQGLSVICDDTIVNYTKNKGLPDNYISAILQKDKNTLYIGTGKRGLCVADVDEKHKKCNFRVLDISLNDGETRIDDILKDTRNVIWVGGSKGLYYSVKDNVFHEKKLLNKSVNVQRILQSSSGKLYIGTKQNGLFIIDGNKIENLFNDSINNIGIVSICEDLEGNIWVASQYNGVMKLDSNNTKWINDKNGLASTLVYILQSDSRGNIWVGANLGLDRINVDKYNKTGKIDIHHYGINDGLQALEMNLNGSFEDLEGNLWFATNNGLLKYNYRYDISNRVPPIISLQNIRIHSKNVDWSKYADSLTAWSGLPVNPILPYNQNHITFEFIGVSYKNPKNIKYSWKLEGFDKKWVPSNTNRQVIYSNLPSGEYVFKVKSSNNDGVWNDKFVEFAFTIEPPIWLTWWFITLAVFVFIAIIYFYIRFRMRSLRKRQVDLELIVRDRTQEIFLQKEELKSQRDTMFEQKQKIEEIHFRLSDSIDYAKRIQDSILPDEYILLKDFSEHFVMFKPKDKVSGDFYWWTKVGNKTIITAVDCTGHGVPGAFMSMLGVSYLREIIEKEGITEPGLILDLLRKNIIEALNQKGNYDEQKDGMDMALITVDHSTNIVKYAGANNPLYIISNINHQGFKTLGGLDGFYEVKPDKMPIAIYPKMKNFTTKEIQLQKGDYLYLFSDGFPDQFGGRKLKKFGYKKLRNLFVSNVNKSMIQQKEILEKELELWKGDTEQIDDIVVIGLRL